MNHRDIALAMFSVDKALEFPEYCTEYGTEYALSRAHDALHQVFASLPAEDMRIVDDMLTDLDPLRRC